ncbi:hypothetical protein OHB26_12785 [Nocardia sp. NBC_01503]|uniref:hypothetical protein n=1 Tax=Nocardia sp. NBC_01503 TaxID=2975997 RepID=UPI002E7BC26A|nr:hypothetical protein [Nocardia sp. NBC_01503]WTL34984.1 hypothetical protein OHB26_12785 [Nocardia sp. NBC_01503]
MATGVGLRIADDESVVAVVTGDDATLPVHYIVRESILHMSDDGDAVLGGDAPGEDAHSISGFVAAVGDPAGMPVDEGEAYRAEDLMATAAFCLINLAADHLNGPAEFYATHPTGWPEANVRALREALDYLGLKSVVLVSERDLPQSDGDTGKSFAYNAARAALAAVLATPAGLTPPDPDAGTANAADVTDILPALATAEPPLQAYSAAIPTATTVDRTVGPVTAEQPIVRLPRQRANRGTYLIAAATALIGLLLGALGVAAVLRQDDSTPGPPRGEVANQPVATAGAAPPLPPPPPDSSSEAPPPSADSVDSQTTTVAPPTTTPPPTTEAPPTTTARPTPPPTTVTTPPYYRYPPVPTWSLPTPPVFQDPWPLYPN